MGVGTDLNGSRDSFLWERVPKCLLGVGKGGDGTAPRYVRDQCDFKTKTRSYVAVHRRAKHEGVMYRCNQCHFEASLRATLRLHQKLEHKDTKTSLSTLELNPRASPL